MGGIGAYGRVTAGSAGCPEVDGFRSDFRRTGTRGASALGGWASFDVEGSYA
jgi:hypothetical protein